MVDKVQRVKKIFSASVDGKGAYSRHCLKSNKNRTLLRHHLMAKGQDKRSQGDKTKAQSTLKEKRAQKRAKRGDSKSSTAFIKVD